MIFLIISILLHGISIWYNRKIELNIWYRSLQKSTPKAWCFHPPCFTVGMVFLGLYSSFFLQTRRVEFIPKSSILVSWPSPMPPLDHPDGLWQTSDGPGHVLAWAGGTLRVFDYHVHLVSKAINPHHLLSDGAAITTQSRSSLTS